MNDKVLAGRVAMITGASRRKGIGFAIARRLASMGANLFIHSYSPYDAGKPWGAEPRGITPLLEELRRIGSAVEHQEGYLLEVDTPRRLFQCAIDLFGRVDILIVNHAHSGMGSLEDLTAADIDQHLLVNVRASLLLVQAFALQKHGLTGGRIVLLTSGQHLGPMPAELAYIASKGALHHLTLSLSAHLMHRGITVNAVNPGATDTGLEAYRAKRNVLSQVRLGKPEDAARLVSWLVTDDAQWITGQVIDSNGGGFLETAKDK